MANTLGGADNMLELKILDPIFKFKGDDVSEDTAQIGGKFADLADGVLNRDGTRLDYPAGSEPANIYKELPILEDHNFKILPIVEEPKTVYFKGKDGREYPDHESLEAANRAYNEKMFTIPKQKLK